MGRREYVLCLQQVLDTSINRWSTIGVHEEGLCTVESKTKPRKKNNHFVKRAEVAPIVQ